MKNLSVSQKYLICSLNKKGLVNINYEEPTCFITGCLFDLMFSGNIKIDKENKITVFKALKDENRYLESLYNYLCKKGSVRMCDVISKYVLPTYNNDMKQLFSDVCKSIEIEGYLNPRKKTLFNKKERFLANKDKQFEVVKQLKNEILLHCEKEEQDLAIIHLLKKANIIDNFFEGIESKLLNKYIEDTKNDFVSIEVERMMDFTRAMSVMMPIAAWVV